MPSATCSQGRDLVLVIDVQGARQVRRRLSPDTVGVFVMPPSFAVLEQRLRGRSKDTEAAMQRRLETARAEVAAFAEYEYVIVNDELEACVDRSARNRARGAHPPAIGARRSGADRQHVSDRIQDNGREDRRQEQVRAGGDGRRARAPAAARLHAADRGPREAGAARGARDQAGPRAEGRCATSAWPGCQRSWRL